MVLIYLKLLFDDVVISLFSRTFVLSSLVSLFTGNFAWISFLSTGKLYNHSGKTIKMKN